MDGNKENLLEEKKSFCQEGFGVKSDLGDKLIAGRNRFFIIPPAKAYLPVGEHDDGVGWTANGRDRESFYPSDGERENATEAERGNFRGGRPKSSGLFLGRGVSSTEEGVPTTFHLGVCSELLGKKKVLRGYWGVTRAPRRESGPGEGVTKGEGFVEGRSFLYPWLDSE